MVVMDGAEGFGLQQSLLVVEVLRFGVRFLRARRREGRWVL